MYDKLMYILIGDGQNYPFSVDQNYWLKRFDTANLNQLRFNKGFWANEKS